jgi:hypothetical protein
MQQTHINPIQESIQFSILTKQQKKNKFINYKYISISIFTFIINDCSQAGDAHVMIFLPLSYDLSIFVAVTVIF